MKLSKILLLVLVTITIGLAQPFTISGKITFSAPIGDIGTGAQFQIEYKGEGTLPSYTFITGPALIHGHNFTTAWSGTTHIHLLTPGFTFEPDSFPLDNMNPQNPRVTHNFIVTDIQGPKIDSVSITPQVLKVGDTVTLLYRTVDNMCNNASKLIEISYDNGPWEYVDSTFESYNIPPLVIPNYFIYAVDGDWRSKKAQKFVPTKSGIAKFRITVGDFSGNKTTIITTTFYVQPIVSILNRHNQTQVRAQMVSSVFDLSGRRIINKGLSTKCYVIRGGQTLNKLYLK